MSFELTKSEKKITRQLIEKCLQMEFSVILHQMDGMISEWKSKNSEPKVAYHEVYKALINYDKHISGRYDKLNGGNYIFVVAGLYADGFIKKEDLDGLREETIARIYFLAGVA